MMTLCRPSDGMAGNIDTNRTTFFSYFLDAFYDPALCLLGRMAPVCGQYAHARTHTLTFYVFCRLGMDGLPEG
jgi:hypothetical protein